jgi:hypothetical protein
VIVSQDALERFERQVARVRSRLQEARRRGMPVPSDAALDDFIARNRLTILRGLTELLARREAPIDPGQPDAWTESRRTAANLEAMQLLVSKPAGSHTVEERRVLARYSGWGGLSIDKAQAAFPPSLQVDTRDLIHAYYSPSALVAEIARVTRPLLADLVGLDGVIRAIEPSAGIGRFILAFDALGTAPIRWTAVEYSALAAMLLSAVRPGLTVFTGPFERWVAQHWDEAVGRINFVISNPPFGQRGEAAFEDRDRDYREKTAMAYFLRRGLDLLAPNGLGIFVVPMGFMSDPKRRKLRETILLGNHVATAFRLPSHLRLPDGRKREHFPGAHNVTDLIFFRRRAGLLAELDAEDVPIAEGRYFEMVPRHVLGDIDTSYRLAVIGPPVRLPELIERPICQDCRIRVAAPRVVAAPAEASAADPRVLSAQGLVGRVDAYLAALAGARPDDPSLLWPELVDALRGWTTRHGNPYAAQNLRALAKDKDLARTFLRAFENDGSLIQGLRERPPVVTRPILSGDLLALAEHIYRQERGLSLPRLMQENALNSGTESREAALALLVRAGWCLDGPGLSLLLPGEDYYSGDLWARYDRAIQHPDDPQAQEQARRLLATIRPALLHDLGEYSVREGWVPLPLIAGWLHDTINGGYPEIELIRASGLVQVRGIDYADLDASPQLAPLTINFLGWLNHDKVNFSPERKKLQSLNEARDEKIAQWSRDFRDWIAGAPERQRTLLEAYNRVARGFVLPSYSDEPIRIARWTTNSKRQLFDYQRMGVRRLLANRGGILVYDVGVGKTFTALAAIGAARQEGWVRRPVVLVPNSLILQWRNETAAVLPDYRVLLIGTNIAYKEENGQLVETTETDKPEQRAQKWARFQAGEYDLALLTYSSMSRTRMDMDAATALVQDTPAVMRQLALQRRSITDKDPKDRTERERAILEEGIPAWILERLELPKAWEYDGDIKWDDLGIDLLVIDEIHNFKNLFKPEPREYGVPAFMGSPGEGSDRAWQLCFRTAAIRRRSGGAGIIGLSATPAKNSPTELYTAVSYVNPRAWTDLRIHDAEQFIDRFCIIEKRPVVTVSMAIEDRSAMVGFKNLIDLRSILTRLLEMRSAEEMAALGRLKKPRARQELVRVDLDDAQRAKTGAHADAFAAKMATGGGNMALGLIVRLGLVAIHAQLDEGYSWDNALGGDDMPAPDSFRSPKFLAVAERIVATPGCGHIVFLEPLAAQIWLREVLVEYGIPRAKIALLNAQAAKSAADRQRLAQGFNEGRYIVIIANSVGGEGANLQTRTCAVHNVDLPWDPMTRRQRNGRADRQGNELDAIVIYDYLARSSGDGPRFAKIQGKGTWIDQVMESEEDIVSNPSAMVEVSPIELIADLTTDPDKTRALLEQVAREEAAARRGKLLRQVARLMRSADARFRAAERAEAPLDAARLRQEGQAELTNLRTVDASIWPFFDQARVIERQPALIPGTGVPFYEGLQLWHLDNGQPMHREYGRVEDRRIGERRAGRAVWTTVGLDTLETIALTPASFTGAWPDDAAATQTALAEALDVMGRRGAWEDLGLMWASERFLDATWPRIADAVRDRLAARTWSTTEDLYPATDSTGALFLANTRSLAGMRLLSPGLSGFADFLRLAAASAYKVPELREVARLWWERSLPTDFRPTTTAKRSPATSAPATPATPGSPATSAPTTPTMTYAEPGTPIEQQDPRSVRILDRIVARLGERFTVEGVRSGQGYRVVNLRSPSTDRVFTGLPIGTLLTTVSLRHVGDPEILDGYSELKQTLRDHKRTQDQYRAIRTFVQDSIDEITADEQHEPATITADEQRETAAKAAQPAAEAKTATSTRAPGLFWRVGDRWFGDTNLIPKQAQHVGFGDFEAPLPGGRLYFARRSDDKLLPGQSGRLHELSLREGSDLPGVLEALAAEGLAQLGGVWDDWPREASETEAPASSNAPLAQVPPADDGDDEDDADDEADTAADTDGDTPLASSLLAPPPVPAVAGELAFMVEAKELQGALNLIRRVSIPGDKKLKLVQIECRGHVFFRVGSPDSFFELRFTTTRCISPGDATVETKQLAASTKHLTAGALQVQKKPREATLQIGSGGRQVSVPTAEYVPIPLDADLQGDATIPLDAFMGLLDRTLFAVSTDASRPQLHQLSFKAQGEQLTAFATEGHMLAMASVSTPAAAALDGQTIAYPALVRLHKLLQEYEKTARPRRGRKDTAAPLLGIQTSTGDPGHLAVATELFTFVAARAPVKPASFDAVIAKASNITTVCIVNAAELLGAMKPLASAKETAEVKVDSPLEITSGTFSFTLRDLFLDGPPLALRINATFMRHALEGLQAGRPYVALAFTTPDGPVLVMGWPDPALPRTRRDARGPVLAGLESKNITIVMPMRR